MLIMMAAYLMTLTVLKVLEVTQIHTLCHARKLQ